MAATLLRLVPLILAIALLSGCLADVLTHDPAPLTPESPRAQPFAISGNLDVPMSPGTSGPLDLTLTNPYGHYMTVTRLSATVSAVVAPAAGMDRPCTRDDFAVEQFSGPLPLDLPASATKSLGELGIPTRQMPAVRMLNTDLNQDGCKNATLTLTYTGTAEGPR